MSIFSRYKNALQNERFFIKTLSIIIVALILLVGYLAYGLKTATKDLTIHIPPDLRSGSVRAWWDIPTSSIYAFSFYIFQQLNRWPQNGETDYKKNIELLSPYFTPSCQQSLIKDYETRSLTHELRDRTRAVYEMPGRVFSEKRVQINSKDDWFVSLDLSIDEYVKDQPIKQVYIRYPIHVVRMDVDPERNPWGLALNCFYETPKRIEIQKQTEEAK